MSYGTNNGNNRIKLSDHFGFSTILRFALPSVVMMVFTSLYGIIDGLFISNFVGTAPFAAINLMTPCFAILGSVGFMLGAGGCAIVAKRLGEGKWSLANRTFSLIVYTVIAVGIILTVLGQIFLPQVIDFLGGEGEMYQFCLIYGRINFFSTTFYMLQYVFQDMFVAAEKPKLGLVVTVSAGLVNITLDALFILVFHWGMAGAALATTIAEFTGGTVPLFYFARENDSLLRLGKTRMMWDVIAKASSNGASEMVTSIAMSVVTILYNWQLIKYAGTAGVAAYGVIMYVAWIFANAFMGYSMGIAPVISYKYGAEDRDELSGLFRRSLIIIGISGIVMTAVAFFGSPLFSGFFVGYDEQLRSMTLTGMRIYAFSFLLFGFNMFGSSLFTALNNGKISAIISFARMIVFECGAVMILPLFFGIMGIWSSILVSETCAGAVAAFMMVRYSGTYGYGNKPD